MNFYDDVKKCLENCKVIKENKEHIIFAESVKDMFILNGKDFLFNVGLCFNAGLYNIDKYGLKYLAISDCESKKLNDINDVLEYISYKFIMSTYPEKYNKYVCLEFPVLSMDTTNWQNEYRWLFVDFVIEQLEEILAV